MIRRMGRASAGALICGLLLPLTVGANPAVAAEPIGGYVPAQPSEQVMMQLESALLHSMQGTATQAELDLLATYPQLVDNVEPVYTFESSAEDAPVPPEAEAKVSASAVTTATSATTTCRIYTGWVNSNSQISGSRLYTWHQRLYVCARAGAMVSVIERYHYVTNRDWSWVDHGIVNGGDSIGPFGYWSISSYMRGEMAQCVWSVCSRYKYPWIKIVAHANNTANITGGHA